MNLEEEIFTANESNFSELALEVFHYQYNEVEIYQHFCRAMKRTPENVKVLDEIPFLPIEFFKTHHVIVRGKVPEKIFKSSGTTGSVASKHLVANTALYEKSFQLGFEKFYGHPTDYVILALLPSYMERGNSSLVYMADKLISESKKNASGFWLHQMEELYDLLDVLKSGNRKTILLGVTFALLEFAERFKIDFPDLIVMETGGMKGRREELTRDELHRILHIGFGVQHIQAEYGMTELLSQAYSKQTGVFHSPTWMRVFTRDIYEPQYLQMDNSIKNVIVRYIFTSPRISYITKFINISPYLLSYLQKFNH